MSKEDDRLRELLKHKYNVVIDGVDCIEMDCIQLVINTVRQEHDKRATKIMEAAFVELSKLHKSKVDPLKQALIGMVDMYTAMINSGDCGNWDPEGDKEVMAARVALKELDNE